MRNYISVHNSKNAAADYECLYKIVNKWLRCHSIPFFYLFLLYFYFFHLCLLPVFQSVCLTTFSQVCSISTSAESDSQALLTVHIEGGSQVNFFSFHLNFNPPPQMFVKKLQLQKMFFQKHCRGNWISSDSISANSLPMPTLFLSLLVQSDSKIRKQWNKYGMIFIVISVCVCVYL